MFYNLLSAKDSDYVEQALSFEVNIEKLAISS